MPRGDKSSYTDKQKRKAGHIEKGYEARGVPAKEAEARAWATVNKDSGGGNKSGSGRGRPDTHASARNGGRAAANRPAADRSAAGEEGLGDAPPERGQMTGTLFPALPDAVERAAAVDQAASHASPNAA